MGPGWGDGRLPLVGRAGPDWAHDYEALADQAEEEREEMWDDDERPSDKLSVFEKLDVFPAELRQELLTGSYKSVLRGLADHAGEIEAVATQLVARRRLDGDDLEAILGPQRERSSERGGTEGRSDG